jgi:hypothetical protein
MGMMTDRELSDIGLTRSDIARVFEPLLTAPASRRISSACAEAEADPFQVADGGGVARL